MTTEGWQAWMVHCRWVGDTSAQLFFLTEERGMISARYRGARSAKKQSTLQLFTPLWVAADTRYEYFYIQSVEGRGAGVPLVRHGLYSGLYMNELLFKLLTVMDPQPQLFLQYETALRMLSEAQDRYDIEPILRLFEYHLLVACGYAVSLTHDSHAHPICDTKQYRFCAGDGFIPQADGLRGRDILAFAAGQLQQQHLQTAKRIMRLAIDHAMDGRPIKSRELYQR